MRFPDELSPGSFLSGYWQKRSLFMPGALDPVYPSLDPGEIAWLATQDDVECRLVHTERPGAVTRYRISHGPFDAHTLSSLPERDWTLLVHDVEKHLPDFRAWFDAVDFIPDWRIEDLMVSYAAPGGSAGPHRDNYDVFLCQATGQREWRLGTNEDGVPDNASGELSLLEPFVDNDPRVAGRGDVLYLPPGIPHWGIARDACITYSIGMRAPGLAELIAAAESLFGAAGGHGGNAAQTKTDALYEDPDLSADEAVPGLISEAAVQRAKRMLSSIAMKDDRHIAMALGSVATELKGWLRPDCLSDDEASDLIGTLEPNFRLGVHGMARIAWARTGGTGMFFANGRASEVPAAWYGHLEQLCRERSAAPGRCGAGDGADLLRLLLTGGVIDLTEWSR